MLLFTHKLITIYTYIILSHIHYTLHSGKELKSSIKPKKSNKRPSSSITGGRKCMCVWLGVFRVCMIECIMYVNVCVCVSRWNLYTFYHIC
jgi:hypothetical protein